MSWMQRAFAPDWAGAWGAARWAFTLTLFYAHLPRFARIEDAYACTDMLFTTGPWRLADFVVWTPESATGMWWLGIVGLAGMAWGGRLFRTGLLLHLIGAWALLGEEALNVKAHDRLGLWVALAFFLSPANERDLTVKWRSPVARWYLLVVFGWLYWSTGTLKFVKEPGWFDGEALQYHLLHRFHAGGPVAVWMSTQNALCRVLGWFTLAFEIGFPFLVLWRRSNPWVLLAGAAFHLGVMALMSVGAFSFVALSAYPAMLHPEVAREWWGWLQSRLQPRAPAARSSEISATE